ncbi:MAG: glycosyltransferase family 2 protein, partial [Lachnospiraceae bacterium]|nr:glycosyltransferase family 2 protein [Lachnospiraceae bacterium]
MTVDLIISTYKPDDGFVRLVDAMAAQTVAPGKIIIINKEEKYFDRLLFNGRFMDNHKNIEVHHISTNEFDCGKSLNQAIKYSEADYVLLMKQDA